VKFFQKYYPTLVAAGTSGLVALVPMAQDIIAQNPKVSMALAMVGMVIAHLAPSPLPPKA
jgi:hypothetical protein